MTQELQTLSTLIKMYLEQLSPVLSGNMKNEIGKAELIQLVPNEVTFCIKAPFYDMHLWKHQGIILHSGEKISSGKLAGYSFTIDYGNITDYAMWLNEVGAFGTHNASMHWVNRVLNQVASMIPNAEVINKLEL